MFICLGFTAPEVSRWSVLLALAAIKGNSVWDVVAMCSRVTFHCKGEEENYMPIMIRYASCVHAYHNLYMQIQ